MSFTDNLRYAMSSCLWGFPDDSVVLSTVCYPSQDHGNLYTNFSQPCITNPACGEYQTNMEFDDLASNGSTFGYCTGFLGPSSLVEPRCLSCLQQLSDDFYMSNCMCPEVHDRNCYFFHKPLTHCALVFTALVAGCEQQPNPGTALSLQGSLFSTNPMNITTPVPTTSAVAFNQSINGLTLGAVIGAAVGGLVALLTTIGCCIIWCGKRRRRRILERSQARLSYNGARPATGNVEPKWGRDAPGGWTQDDTPTTAGGYGSDKQNFSPYMSQYTSPVSARDMLNPKALWEAPQQSTTVEAPGIIGLGIKDEAFEMEKMRDQRIEERRIRELRLHEEFLQEAAERGFTTAPIIQLPNIGKGGHR
jgi:hypothetical protein